MSNMTLPAERTVAALIPSMPTADLVELRSTAKAAAKKYWDDAEKRTYAEEVALRSFRELGQRMADDPGYHPGGREHSTTLGEWGMPDANRAMWAQALARWPDDCFEGFIADKKAKAEPITEHAAWRASQDVHVSEASGQNEWWTPPRIIEAARQVMGDIDLDPATAKRANERIVKAARYFTEQDDGLTHDWAGRVWMNPPYAQPLIAMFCAKLCRHLDDGTVPEAIVLVNNATETGWFQPLARRCAAVCFHAGRVKFLTPEEEEGAPLQGQAILYFGPHADSFVNVFGQFGIVLCRAAT